MLYEADSAVDAVLRSLRPGGPPGLGGPQPLTDATHRGAAAAVIGQPAVDWAVWTADRLCRFVLHGTPQIGGSSALERLLRRSAESRILDILVHLARGTEPDHATTYAVAVASDFARRGVELQHALTGITLGHQFLSRTLLDLVEDAVPEGQRFTVSRTISDQLFRYHNIQLADVAEAYEAERVRWTASTAAARRATVARLLAGDHTDLRDASRLLDYDLAGHHVALVLWQAPDRSGTIPATDLQRTARRIGAQIGCTNTVTVVDDPSTVWAWCGRQSPFARGDLTRLQSVRPERDILVALGDPARGVDGFRRSHRTAALAQRVTTISRQYSWLADYHELGLAALLTADPAAARWFVEQELNCLAAGDQKTADIRETVRCYLGTGCSLIATARHLQIARNTVIYRIKRAEELLGKPIGDRVVELHAALEVLRVLGVPNGPSAETTCW